MKIIQFCLKQAMPLNLLVVVIMVTGFLEATRMKREAFPHVDFDVVSISTPWPGASSEEVEKFVTNPLEKEIESLQGIDEILSSSRENFSSIALKLDPDLSKDRKRSLINDLQRAVDQVTDLPEDLPQSPLVKEINSEDFAVMEVGLFGDLSYGDLHQHAEKIIDLIEELPGANKTLQYGYQDHEYWVEVDPEKLKKFHISLQDIIHALQLWNIDLPGGVLKSDKGEFLVRTIGQVQSAEGLSQILLRSNTSGVQLRIADVAQVRKTFEENNREYRTNGQPSINIIVRINSQGDIIDLTSAVRKVVSTYTGQNPEVEAAFVNDISSFVKNRLGVLVNNGVFGIVLVLLALFLFLSKGIALVAACGMPIAFIGALVVMSWMGITINLLSMFALVIVLGMLVDDAIIVAENIWHHYEQGKSPWDAAVIGTSEVFWPVTATILTTISAFSPLLMITGVFGKFMAVMPKVVIICLVISLIEAMFILPSHAYDMLRLYEKNKSTKPENKAKKDTPYLTKITHSYGLVLEKVLQFRYLAFGGFLAALFASLIYAATTMKKVLFPADGIETFFVLAERPHGSSREDTSFAFRALEKALHQKLPNTELKDTVTYIGLQQNDPLDPFKEEANHLGQIGVYLVGESERERNVESIINSIRPVMTKAAEEAGLINLHFNPIRTGPPVGKPIAVRFEGENLDNLLAAVRETKKLLKDVPHVKDITSNDVEGKKEIQVKILPEKASAARVSTQDIGTHIRAMMEGMIASYSREKSEKIPIRVRYQEGDLKDVRSLQESPLMNRAGYMIPLSSITTLDYGQGINNIRHYNTKRTLTVTAGLDESQTTSSEVNQQLLQPLQDIAQKHDVFVKAGGEYEDTTNSMESLQQAFLIAIGLIFIILATQFRSLTQPLVIMTGIPFGLIGVIIAFEAHNLPLSFLGMIGMIGLTGVVVNDSIVLVDFINKSREQGLNAFDACLQAGKRRFRAVWLTSLTTVSGLLPLAYGIGGSDNFLRPAAMALGYGLLFSTCLILLMIPAVYLIRVDIITFFVRIFTGDREKQPL